MVSAWNHKGNGERDCSTTAMAERRDSGDSLSETGDSDITSMILSSSSYQYIDSEGGVIIELYAHQFEPENEAGGHDFGSTGDDDDDHKNDFRLGNTHW